MRILKISDVFFPRVNGVSTSIRTFRNELLALGHRVTLLAPAYSGMDHSATDDADLIRLPARSVPFDPEDRLMQRRAIDALLPKLRSEHYDVVHIHTPFVAHYAGVALARALDVPVVETYHTFFEEYLHHYVPLAPRAAMRWIARRFSLAQCNAVDRIVAPSLAMHSALINYGVRTPIDVLPTGLTPDQFRRGDGARFRTRYGIGATRPMLLHVGRVAHEKNIDFILRMFVHVQMQKPDALLVIAGEGPAQAHLRALAASLGVSDAVQFIGYLERDTELLDCYAAGNLFVFASRTETQGLVLLEALAQGTPVVSTVHMGTRDVLEGARGARIVAEDERAFAHAVAELLRDTNARQHLAQLAPLDARNWSARRMTDRLVEIYAGLASMRQKTAA
jgi:1,2-diacylglycerol 3-alpha-glucosyltransferase